MSQKEIDAAKEKYRITTINPSYGYWYASVNGDGSTLVPSANFCNETEEKAVAMAVDFLDKVGF